jgi:uncharacterized protein Yka (UPF0111/DUF47 family)
VLRFLPREDRFFTLFSDTADRLVRASGLIESLLSALAQGGGHAQDTEAVVYQGSELSRRTGELLDQTFITPLDRADIQRLSAALGGVGEQQEIVVKRVRAYGIRASSPCAVRLAALSTRSTARIRDAVECLRRVRERDGEIRIACAEVAEVEREASAVAHAGLSRLYREGREIGEVLTTKELYDALVDVATRCRDVAELLEAFAFEYA